MPAPVLTITPAAVARAKALLEKRGTPAACVRVGVKSGGCSGLTYKLEFADSAAPGDEVITQAGVTFLIPAAALLYLLGTEMDFQETPLKSGFVFNNPQAKNACGCGESFQV